MGSAPPSKTRITQQIQPLASALAPTLRATLNSVSGVLPREHGLRAPRANAAGEIVAALLTDQRAVRDVRDVIQQHSGKPDRRAPRGETCHVHTMSALTQRDPDGTRE
jgi:hypothetical protein